jgi:hypothetical protein
VRCLPTSGSTMPIPFPRCATCFALPLCAKRDQYLRWSAQVSHVRYHIDTAFGQLVDRCNVKRVWALDPWHLCGRLLHKVLMHIMAILLTVELGNLPMHLARLAT